MTGLCCQQYGLYGAEERVPRGRAIRAEELQSFVDNLRETTFWERTHADVMYIETSVRKSDGQGSCGAWDRERGCGVIEMAPCHLCELFVVHEVSHVLAAQRYGSHAHDPWFADTYLRLLTSIAPDLYLPLFESFTRAGIDFRHDSFVPAGIPLPAAS
jgi:hypothetical protein